MVLLLKIFGMVSIWTQDSCFRCSISFHVLIHCRPYFLVFFQSFPFSTSRVRRNFSDKSSLLGYQLSITVINYAENKTLHNDGHLLCCIFSISHEFESSWAKWPGLAFLIRMLSKCWPRLQSSEGLSGVGGLLPK